MQVYNDDDLHGGQRSSEVKCGKLCAMVTKLGQNPWFKFIMMTFMEVKGHQRLNVVNYALWGQRSSEVKCGKLYTMVTKLGQKNPWCKFIMMMTFTEVKGHQRLNVVNYALWLPYLVKRIADSCLKWLCHSKRSKVKYSTLCSMATNLFRRSLMIGAS